MLLIFVLTVFSFGWSFPFTKQKKTDRLADAIDLTKLPSRNETIISHYRISNAEPCIDNKEERPCICTQEFQPYGCICSGGNAPFSCTCPDDPEALQYIKDIQCKCVEGDLRQECEGYHYWPEDEIFFPMYQFDDEGKYVVSTIYGQKMYDHIKIDYIDPLGEYYSEDDQYYVFPSLGQIDDLKVSQPINFDIERCGAMKLLYEQYYKLLGYAAYTYLGENIAPSLIYALMNAPREGTKVDAQTQIEEGSFGVERGCEVGDYNTLDENIYVGFEKDGLVKNTCVPNYGEVPYSTYNDEEEDSLPVVYECENSTQIKHYLEGLKIGIIQEVSSTMLMKYILRVGPVYGKLSYIPDEYEGPRELPQYEGLIIGWKNVDDQLNWVVVMQNDDEQFIQDVPFQVQFEVEDSSVTYYSQFTGKVVYYKVPKPCTDNREEGPCICTQDFQPYGCLCSGESHPYSCTCPESPKALQNIEEIQCKCVDGDMRHDCEGYYQWPEDEIFFPHYAFDDEGKYVVSTYNGQKLYDRIKIFDIDRLGEYYSEDDKNFVFATQRTIARLNVSQPINFDIGRCGAMKLLYEQYYKLLGYAAYTYLGENIAPSLVYALMNAPREVTKIDDEDPEAGEQFSVERGCEVGDFNTLDENVYVGFEKDGLVSDSCVPNSQEIPYSTYNDEEYGVDGLPVATQCADQSEIKHYLKGLKIGLIQEVSSMLLMSYIIRVGPVYGKLRYIPDGSVDPAQLEPVEGLIIGWKVDEDRDIINWIMVQQNGELFETYEVPSEVEGSSGSYFTGKVVYYQEPQVINPPTEEPPIYDTPIYTEAEKGVEIKKEDRNEDGTVEDKIEIPTDDDQPFSLLIEFNSTDLPNEIYAQTETIEIGRNNALVLQSNGESEYLPVLRAIGHSSGIDINVPSLVHVSGDAQMEINSFIIEHSQNSVVPLLQTEGHSLFRLVGVTLSGQKRKRDEETDNIVIDDSQQQGQFHSPFLEVRGKKVVIKDVIVEPTNFVDCHAIDMNGDNEEVSHQALTEDSTFQQWNRNNGGKSYLNLNRFTSVFKNSNFQGVDINAINANKQRINEIIRQTCDWNTASVNIDNSTGYFDVVTFNNLGEGALKVDNNGIATLKETVKFYRNYPIQGTDASQVTPRNIVCGKDSSSPAQLLAESSSFKEAEADGSTSGSISKNKWVSADNDNCQITGTLNDEKFLLFTPEIQSITAKANKDKTGIDVELKGKSLFRCGKLFLQVSLKPKSSKNADDITSKEYALEQVAQTWENEESVSASIKEDDFVKKGKKYGVSVRMETKDGTHSDAEVISGGKSSADVEGFGKSGLSTGVLIAIIVVVVVVVIAVVILLIVIVYCCMKKSKNPSSEKNKSDKGVEMKSNKW